MDEPETWVDRATPAQRWFAELCECAVFFGIIGAAAWIGHQAGQPFVNLLHWLAASLH